jgi:hypothetical protein
MPPPSLQERQAIGHLLNSQQVQARIFASGYYRAGWHKNPNVVIRPSDASLRWTELESITSIAAQDAFGLLHGNSSMIEDSNLLHGPRTSSIKTKQMRH